MKYVSIDKNLTLTGINLEGIQMYAIVGMRAYTIGLVAEQSDYPSLLPTFERVVGSFEFINQTSAITPTSERKSVSHVIPIYDTSYQVRSHSINTFKEIFGPENTGNIVKISDGGSKTGPTVVKTLLKTSTGILGGATIIRILKDNPALNANKIQEILQSMRQQNLKFLPLEKISFSAKRFYADPIGWRLVLGGVVFATACALLCDYLLDYFLPTSAVASCTPLEMGPFAEGLNRFLCQGLAQGPTIHLPKIG